MTVNPARHGPFPGGLHPEVVAAYAEATRDDTASVLSGAAVPAVSPVLLVLDAVEAARHDVSAAAWRRARGGVHADHDIVIHRPLQPGETLDTWSRISAVRTSRSGTRVTVHLEQRDAHDAMVVEQWWTMVLLGLDGLADLGSTPADHSFPKSARANPVGSASAHLDVDMPHRYAEVSGDWAAHHFDADVARASGFDSVFAHGLCTLAVCTHRLLGVLHIEDPGRVSRVAVRFAAPTPLDCELTVTAFGIDERRVAFEATAGGATTITNGRLELRS